MINRLLKSVSSLVFRSKKKINLNKELQLPSKKLYKKYYTYSSVDEIPDVIQPNILYHVGENNFKWVVILKCPCGCHDTLQLNLLKDTNPRWRVKFHYDGDISLYPSINRIVNCRSHFNITKNNVRWWDTWII